MKDKRIIDVCPYQGECSVSGCKRNDDGCFVRQLFEERYRAENQIVELNKTIKAKEQECEFNNLRIIQLQETLSQYETDLSTKDCIVETCKAQYKELEAENEELKKYKDVVDKLAGMQVILTNEEKMPMLYENAKDLKLKQLSKTLTEIKKIAEEQRNSCDFYWSCEKCTYFCYSKQILQKISECEVK